MVMVYHSGVGDLAGYLVPVGHIDAVLRVEMERRRRDRKQAKEAKKKARRSRGNRRAG